MTDDCFISGLIRISSEKKRKFPILKMRRKSLKERTEIAKRGVLCLKDIPERN